MGAEPPELPYGLAEENLYAAGMARTELMGIEKSRQTLGERLREANSKDEVHTVVTKHGKPDGAIVGMDWYRRAREALGEPTDL